ncbi:MAG: protein YgfX [Pseudomonadota bacterium]
MGADLARLRKYPPLTIALGRSKAMLMLLTIGYLGAVASLVWAFPGQLLAGCGCLLLALSWFLDIRQSGLRLGRKGVIALRTLPPEGEWLVSLADGQVLRLGAPIALIVNPFFAVLVFRKADGATLRTVIPRDATAPDSFRRLRVRLALSQGQPEVESP